MNADPDDIATIDLSPKAGAEVEAKPKAHRPLSPADLADYTPAMLAMLLRSISYGGFSNWWPARHEGKCVGYLAGNGAAFVRAEKVVDIIVKGER